MHADTLAAFRAALRGGALPPGLSGSDPDETARRFNVYRNNGTVSLSQALARRFPVIQRLVGEVFFAALARAYHSADPPRSPVLAEWGAGFSGFLAGFPPLAGWPYMADVARIEYARGLAFHAADAAPIAPSALAGADPEALRLGLHPSLAVLRLAHPAVAIWAQNQPGAAPAPLPPGPQIALILRDPAHAVPVESIPPGDAALIEALLQGEPLARAAGHAQRAEPGHDPTPRLVRLMQQGAITRSLAPC